MSSHVTRSSAIAMRKVTEETGGKKCWSGKRQMLDTI